MIFVNLAVLGVWSQPPSLSTPAVEARADTLLKQLSLEEKIDLIGGVDDFYIRRWQDNGAHDSYYLGGAEKKVVYAEGLFLGYRHFEKAGVKPLFPFGFGLSYTTFAYKNLSIIPAHAAGDQTVSVSFDVTNTGHRAAPRWPKCT